MESKISKLSMEISNLKHSMETFPTESTDSLISSQSEPVKTTRSVSDKWENKKFETHETNFES